jgi:hypothetical protein
MVPKPEAQPLPPTMLDVLIARLRAMPGAVERLAAEPGWPEMGERCANILDRIGMFPERAITWATPRLMARITVVVRDWDRFDLPTKACVAYILHQFDTARKLNNNGHPGP